MWLKLVSLAVITTVLLQINHTNDPSLCLKPVYLLTKYKTMFEQTKLRFYSEEILNCDKICYASKENKCNN